MTKNISTLNSSINNCKKFYAFVPGFFSVRRNRILSSLSSPKIFGSENCKPFPQLHLSMTAMSPDDFPAAPFSPPCPSCPFLPHSAYLHKEANHSEDWGLGWTDLSMFSKNKPSFKVSSKVHDHVVIVQVQIINLRLDRTMTYEY